jgi:hypothetical protein
MFPPLPDRLMQAMRMALRQGDIVSADRPSHGAVATPSTNLQDLASEYEEEPTMVGDVQGEDPTGKNLPVDVPSGVDQNSLQIWPDNECDGSIIESIVAEEHPLPERPVLEDDLEPQPEIAAPLEVNSAPTAPTEPGPTTVPATPVLQQFHPILRTPLPYRRTTHPISPSLLPRSIEIVYEAMMTHNRKFGGKRRGFAKTGLHHALAPDQDWWFRRHQGTPALLA